LHLAGDGEMIKRIKIWRLIILLLVLMGGGGRGIQPSFRKDTGKNGERGG